MTRDDIIRMAREADIDWHKHWDDEENRLERFANLVAAAEREKNYALIEILIEAEREACAKKMDELCGKLSSKDNLTKSPTNGRYICHVCNSQEMVRAKFDEESG